MKLVAVNVFNKSNKKFTKSYVRSELVCILTEVICKLSELRELEEDEKDIEVIGTAISFSNSFNVIVSESIEEVKEMLNGRK